MFYLFFAVFVFLRNTSEALLFHLFPIYLRRCLWIFVHTRFFICKYEHQTNQSTDHENEKINENICRNLQQQRDHYLDGANKINAQRNNEKIIIKSISVCFHYIIGVIIIIAIIPLFSSIFSIFFFSNTFFHDSSQLNYTRLHQLVRCTVYACGFVWTTKISGSLITKNWRNTSKCYRRNNAWLRTDWERER